MRRMPISKGFSARIYLFLDTDPGSAKSAEKRLKNQIVWESVMIPLTFMLSHADNTAAKSTYSSIKPGNLVETYKVRRVACHI